MKNQPEAAPLKSLDEWEEDLLKRYPDPEAIATTKATDEYRNYEDPKRETVREFYRLNHTYQTYDFVRQKEEEFLSFNKKEMPVWQAFDFLNQLVDDSDPDTDLDQFQHLLQTSEAIRRDGHPDWMVAVGLLHDTRYGVYSPNCGLRNVHMSWGHDEYVYQMMKNHLPEPGLYMLRYHSFYAQHRENAYDHLMDDHDREMFKWVQLFNPYDLYSKNPNPPDWKTLKPYYEDLVAKYLPATLKF